MCSWNPMHWQHRMREAHTWLWFLAAFAKQLCNPSVVVASTLTFIEVAGKGERWYWIAGSMLVNLLAVRAIVWLITMSVLRCLLLFQIFWKRNASRRPRSP
jgi:hypothetical protein